MKITELIRKNREVGLMDDPQFDKATRFDWRRYVPDEHRNLWKEMSVEARIMVKLFADEVAKQQMSQSFD